MDSRNTDTIAGLAAGFTTTIVGHPLDLVKVRLQLASESQKHPLKAILNDLRYQARKSYKSNPNAFKAKYYLKEVYRGIGPNLIGNISAWSIYFTLYSELKHQLSLQNSMVNYFSASTIAGLSTSLLTNPIWLLKTRILSSSKNKVYSYNSIIDGVRQIVKHEGISTFYRGSIPSFFQVFQNSIQFTIYDGLKLTFHIDDFNNKQVFVCSSIAKVSSMLIMYPFQVLRANLQNYNSDVFIKEIQHLWNTKGFYKGITINLFKVVPSTSVTFMTYELMKSWLSHRDNALN